LDDEIGLRLARIFTPYAVRQREEHVGRSPSQDYARFVHYTSAEGALGIIRTKRLWMRNCTCMSDYREIDHGFDILFRLFADKERKERFTAALDAVAPGVAKRAIDLFDQWSRDIRLNTYVASISEHLDNEDVHGRLSMWRAFGASTSARIAIVLQIPNLSNAANALNVVFSPVAYLTESEAQAVIDSVIEEVSRNQDFLRAVDPNIILGMIFNMLAAAVTCLKHEGFAEEREWRAIYSPQRSPSPWMETSVEQIGGIPQVVYKLPLDQNKAPEVVDLDFARLFDRLIIGPTSYPYALYLAFVRELETAGLTDARNRAVMSEIPIRT
jgi:hypothetical protein